MKLILKETVDRLGKIGEIVDVANGYARNYLIPKGLGLITTPRNLKEFEHIKKMIADKIKKEKFSFDEMAKKISTLSLRIAVQANEDGKLFGSVTAKDIAELISAQGIEMDKNRIVLEKPIKETGSFCLSVKMPHDITTQVNVEIVIQDGALLPSEAAAPDPK